MMKASASKYAGLMAFAVLTTFGFASPLAAQFYVPDPMQLQMSSFINTSYISNSDLDKGEKEPPKTSRSSKYRSPVKANAQQPVSLKFQPVSAPFMADRMAATLALAKRTEAKALYAKMLTTYDQIAPYYGVSRYDLSGSTAVLLVGSYQMHSGNEVSDKGVRAVIEQLRGGLGASAELASADATTRQGYYEQSAITGTLLTVIFRETQTTPNAELQSSARTAATGYLKMMLGRDPDAVIINDNGLQMR